MIMPAITSLNLKPIQEIHAMLNSERQSLTDLAPHNGTRIGATAIARCRREIEILEAELARREAINSTSQEDL